MIILSQRASYPRVYLRQKYEVHSNKIGNIIYDLSVYLLVLGLSNVHINCLLVSVFLSLYIKLA